jgi:HDOD domain-containing protein
MTQVLLVIVIVAAVVLLGTMISMRTKKAPHSGSATHVGQPGATRAPTAAPPQQAERAAVTESPPPAPTSAPGPTEDLSSATLSFNAADLDFALMPTAEDVAPAPPPRAAGDPGARESGTNTAANTANRAAQARGPNANTAAAPSANATAADVGNAPAKRPSDPPPKGPQKLPASEVFAKLFDLALGKARPATAVNPGHQAVVDATALALEDGATQQRYAPRRPNMLPKVLSASSDDSFSRRELAALIAQDPSLVGNLLKIANSSFYRVTPEPVESVDRAVVLLGTDGIRSLVTAALMQPIFRIGGADFPRFPEVAWEHTFRAANASVPYNFLVEKSDPAAAELLSLVMGLASIVVFRVAVDQYSKFPKLRPDAGIVANLLDAHSATVARKIAGSWELSEATIAGLDGQSTTTAKYPTALGRSIYFGRLVGALALLRINHVISDESARASIPANNMPEAHLERMWSRLTPKLGK